MGNYDMMGFYGKIYHRQLVRIWWSFNHLFCKMGLNMDATMQLVPIQLLPKNGVSSSK
jgi:hypothetical protein